MAMTGLQEFGSSVLVEPINAGYRTIPFVSAFIDRANALKDENLPDKDFQVRLGIQAGLLGAAREVAPLTERSYHLFRQIEHANDNGADIPTLLQWGIPVASAIADSASMMFIIAGGVAGAIGRRIASQFVGNWVFGAVERRIQNHFDIK